MASDGRFNPCCAPDALRRALGDFGNVNHASLYDIWQSDAYQRPPVRLHANPPVPGMQHEEANGVVSCRLAGIPHSRRTALITSLTGSRSMRCAVHRGVLKFHSPGLAPVLDNSGAYHVTPDGQPAYESRHVRTFGFYEDRAAAHSADGWFHLLPSGSPLYP